MISKTFTATILTMVLVMVSVVPSWAGAVDGPKYDTFRLSARSYRSFNVSFYGDQLARIEVKGDGDTDLDLLVYDERGNLVASDEDNTDHCYVEWTPRWTGRFTIKVVNHGTVYNDFVIRTN